MDTAVAVLGLFKDTLGPILNIFLIWLLLAIATGTIYEWISSWRQWEASMLEDMIVQMLGDPNLKDKIYYHPLMRSLFTDRGLRKPNIIPEDKFALMLFEQILNSGNYAGDSENEFDKLRLNIDALKGSETNELKIFATIVDTLLIGIEEKENDVTYAFSEAIQRVEGWFNDSMEQLRGSYQRRVQVVAIIVGISISFLFNIDTVAITTHYLNEPIIKQAIDAQAKQTLEQPPSSGQTPSADIANNITVLEALSLPIGWAPNNQPHLAGGWVTKIIGIIISGFAAALGAPFWLDVIEKPFRRRISVASE